MAGVPPPPAAMATAPSASAALKTTPATDAASLGWAKSFEKFYEDGTFTDTIVPVHLEDDVKEGWWWLWWQAKPKPRIIDIRCHSIVLAARSPYFKAALDRGWVEARDKVVQLALANGQSVEDLKLLFKLSYGATYIKEDGVLIDKATRMRLAFLANALEFGDCIDECIASLSDKLTLEDALTCLEKDVPEELREHPAVVKLSAKVVDILLRAVGDLTKGIAEEEDKDDVAIASIKIIKGLGRVIGALTECVTSGEDMEKATKEALQKAADALAKELGPVHDLFEEGRA